MPLEIPDELQSFRFRYTPIAERILGAVLIVASLTVFAFLARAIFLSGGDPDNVESSLLFITLTIVLCGDIWFHTSITSLIAPPVNEIAIDPKARFVDLTRLRIYGSHTDRYFFHQIEKFRSHKRKRFFVKTYFMEVILVNKTKIFIQIPIGEEQHEVTKFIKKLNKIIRSDAPSVHPVRE